MTEENKAFNSEETKINSSEDAQQEIIYDNLPEPKRPSFRSFIKLSGITIVSISIAFISIILGIILFYTTTTKAANDAGLWLSIIGVVIFMFTIIFGFERIEE